MAGRQREEETDGDAERHTVGQNNSERGRRAGKARAREEGKREEEKKSPGKSKLPRTQAGVHLTPLRLEGAEIAKQREERLPKVPEAGAVAVGYEPRRPA